MLFSSLALLGVVSNTVIAPGVGLATLASARGPVNGPTGVGGAERALPVAVVVWLALVLTLVATGLWLTENYLAVP